MGSRLIHVMFRFVVSACLVLTLYAYGPQASAPQSEPTSGREPATMRSLLRYALPGTRDLQLVIELNEPSVARSLATTRGGAVPAGAGRRARVRMDSAEAATYRAQLARTQSAMSERLSALSGVEVQGATDAVMNTIIARVPIEHYRTVRGMEGIKRVYISRLQRKNLSAAAEVHNAPALWKQVPGGRANTGQGVMIGVIDTGIDNTHPMFTDSTAALPSGFPKYSSGNSAYTNHKVIVARDYTRFFANAETSSHMNARDYDGHGTFVAGCAAGKIVTPNTALLPSPAQISGMAPGAFLGSYKVFGTPGVNDYATSAAIIAAINDAVNDGMDVVNLSLGALDYVPPSEDPEVVAIDNAVAAGVVVCIAAGNEGPDMHTIGTPGSSADAISVGAVWNSRVYSAQLHVTGPAPVPDNLLDLAYENGSGPAITRAISGTIADVSTIDGNGMACSPLPAASLSGKFALISRGDCLFSTKVSNASAAGATAVITYNNIMGNGPFAMGGLTGSTPAVMVSALDGLALRDFVAAQPAATMLIDDSSNNEILTTIPTVLAGDSSRGPGPDFGIKPDLVAVGWRVYSAAENSYASGALYDATRYTISQGTSFSTPMVSGAAAAVLQLFPAFTPADVKSALANSASVVTTNGTAPALITQVGGGLLNMGNAANVTAVFYPSHLNFGVNEYSGGVLVTRALGIKNVSSNTDQFLISVQPLVSGPTIDLSTTSTGPVAPGAVANVDIMISASAPLSGGFQGFITVQSQLTQNIYAIPYWAGLYVPDPTRILTVSQGASDPNSFRNLKDALAAANPGNIIEFSDSQTYILPTPSDSSLPSIVISTNAQGLPLHGITIRATAGQTPVLDGTLAGAGAASDLQIVGVRNVLIQGLTINGGDVAIDLLQPSRSVPASVTVDRCTLSNQASSSISDAIWVESGGDIDIIDSTISGSSSAGISISGGAHLTMSNCTVQGNLGGGIDATDSNLDLISSNISGNTGPGVNLANCSGTLTKNIFAGNLTAGSGDGAQIWGGTFTVIGNTFSRNASAGIYFATPSGGAAPTVRLEGNMFVSNTGWGIQSDAARDLQMIGNMVKDNGVGFIAGGTTKAILVNNIIVRSTLATSGNGVDVRGSSQVILANNTIYGNRLRGIARAGAATVSVQNTIVYLNTTGDLSGLSTADIQNSLLSSSAPAVGTNLRGDPQFMDADDDDFRLGAGSPAIDAGSNSAAQLPFLDYNQRYRVASTGSLPGGGIVDIGAIEAGSTFPIVYPLMVNGLNAAINDPYTTGIAVLNSSESPASAVFAAYDTNGNLITGTTNPTLPLALDPAAQVPIFGWQLFGFPSSSDVVSGVLGSSTQKLTGFFLFFDNLLTRLADGVDVSANTATRFLFVRHELDAAGMATYALFNPGVNSATVNATLLDGNGSQIDQLVQPIVLPPKGQRLFNFTNVTASSGVVSVTSDRPISGLELFGNTSEVASLRAAIPSTESRLFFPHFAVNQGYTSFLGVANTAAVPATLKLTSFNNEGSVLGMPAERIVNAGGYLFDSASDLFGLSAGAMIVGYVVVESDQPGITGFCEFRYDDGDIHSRAAVPSDSIPRDSLLFSHIAHQVRSASGDTYLTGVALLNPYGAPVTYTMKVFDSTGIAVAQMTDVIGPRGKVSKLLSSPVAGGGFFTQPISLAGGHIEVTTNRQLIGFELFFTQSLSQLVAVMAQFPN